MIAFNGNILTPDVRDKIGLIKLSRAQYDALGTYDDHVLYEVTEDDNSVVFYVGENEFSGGGGGGGGIAIQLDNVSVYTAKSRSGLVGVKWTDPDDKTLDAIAQTGVWTQTMIRRSTTAAPASTDDGKLVAYFTERNQYSTTYYEDTEDVENGTTYYYTIFCQSNNLGTKVWNTGTSFTITPQAIEPAAPTNLAVKGGNTTFTVTWTDPASTIAETDTTFGDTVKEIQVFIKKGSAASNTLYDDKVTKSLGTQSATFNNVENGATYYVSVYAISTTDEAYSTAATGTAVPVAFRVMTVKINLSDSNPYNNCTYADDAESMDYVHPITAYGSIAARSDAAVKDSDSAAAAAAWDDFFGHKPVLMQNGNEAGDLNPNDFTKYIDGTAAPITSAGYDVMVKFPIRGIKITKSGTTLTVSMTDNPNADGYQYYAHTKGTTKKTAFYLASYLGYNDNSKLYSRSGVTPTQSINLTNSRTYTVTNRGGNYQLMAFYQRLFLQVMYLLKYKNTDGQKALGQGYVSGGSQSTYGQTGTMNTRGMDYGTTTANSNTNRMKIFGIEDFWGNRYQWMDGCFYNSSTHITVDKTNNNFNDSGNGYTDVGTAVSASYLKTPIGGEAGFISADDGSGASDTTYFADAASADASDCLVVGGYSNGGGHCGPFCVNRSSASGASWALSARTCYISTTNAS